ncbi:MAG: NUDIX domain-containing protein [Candidatus Aenigmatarchaeota archaeon]
MSARRNEFRREISAGGLVYNRKTKKFLLIADKHMVWSLPKGRIEKGETAEEAALRETSEETGLPLKRLKILKKLGTIKYVYALRNRKTFKIVVFYLMETDAVRLRPQWEIKGANWFARRDVLKKIGYSNAKEIVRRALSSLRAP